MFCNNCGNQLREDAEFCDNCGNSLKQTTLQNQHQNETNSWFANLDAKVIAKASDVFSGVLILLILFIFRDSVKEMWSETSNKLVFVLHLIFLVGSFTFLGIPDAVIKLAHSIASKKKTGVIVFNFWQIIVCLIMSAVSYTVLNDTKSEITVLIIIFIYGAIMYVFNKNNEYWGSDE